MLFSAPFAAVLVFALALNGQEWYQDTFGTEGRLGGGWVFWSTGGRLVTIAVVFLAIFRATTGWGSAPGDPGFGLGYNADDFPFEAADAIKNLPIAGNVLNTTVTQGGARRHRLAGRRQAQAVRRQPPPPLSPRRVREDGRAPARPQGRQGRGLGSRNWTGYKVAAVMIQVSGDPRNDSPITFGRLMTSPNWVPFYDDGSIVMFGRADAKVAPADLAYFRANRLDADEMAYKRPRQGPRLGAPAHGDLGADRRRLPEPAERPAAAAHRRRGPLAEPGGGSPRARAPCPTPRIASWPSARPGPR